MNMSKRLDQPGPQSLGRNLRLLFEDEHLLIVDKPIGMLSARAGEGPGVASAFDLVRRHVDRSSGAPRRAPRDGRRRVRTVWIIHRIDKDVSGLMVFAKNEETYEALKEELRARRVARRYAAVTEGLLPIDGPDAPWRWVSGYLQDAGPGRPVRVMSEGLGTARVASQHGGEPIEHAVTHYRVIATGKGRSLVEVRLQTGRKHQVRAHLASLGHPVAGDRLYRDRAPAEESYRRVMLHAAELRLTHPATGQAMAFASPPPAVFFKLVGGSPALWREEGKDADFGPLLDAVPPPTPELPEAGDAPGRKPKPARQSKSQSKSQGGAGAERNPHDEASAASLQEGEETPGSSQEAQAGDRGWDEVATWYSDLVGSGASDHHERVVLPGVLRLLAPQRGMRLLDVACGEGRLCRELSELGVRCTGVDASGELVASAARRARKLPEGERPEFVQGDARRLTESVGAEEGFVPFDLAACVLALMNIDPLEPVVRGVAQCLAPGGRFVMVILHPAFRSPGLTSWGWEEQEAKRGGRRGYRQYRRVDGYMTPGARPVVMNPGDVAHGRRAVTTTTWHRPLQVYVRALADSGFVVDALEEWISQRSSDSGPRALEENRARREVPVFMALRALRR